MTLLLLVEIRPLPRSKWVTSIVSASDRCRVSWTRSASSSSKFKMILVLLLLMMPFPKRPSSRLKKSLRSWLAQIADPPKPRMVLKISNTKSPASRVPVAPAPERSCQHSSIKMAFSSVRSALARSQTKSRATNIPTVSKSPVSEEISSTVYLLSSRTLVCLLKVLAEPFTRRLRIWAMRVVSGAALKISYRSPSTGISR